MKSEKQKLYNKLHMRWRRGHGPHPTTIDMDAFLTEEQEAFRVPLNVRCHWCTYIYLVDPRKACPRCNTPYDPEKAASGQINANKPYMGRWSKDEKARIQRMRRYGNYFKVDYQDVMKKLENYIQKKTR